MGINTLQREAFVGSQTFNMQVQGVVQEQALLKNTQWTTANTLDSSTREALARVVKNPGGYGFVPALVADAGWTLSYDSWSDSPAEGDYAILLGVQNMWLLLTGIVEPIAEAGA